MTATADVVVIGDGDGTPCHGQPGFLGSTRRIAEARAIPHQMLDSPMLPGAAGVKAASERYASHVDPDQVDRTVPAAEAQATFDRHVAGRLRGLSRRVVRSATCLYTVTPDAGFIIDRLREDGTVLAAPACSGHGFKRSPALGEHLAELATGAGTAQPSFALHRFAPAQAAAA